MALLGIFSGLLFVPLNALLQWRSPADRRGAIIAMANVLVYARHGPGHGAGPGAGPGRGLGAGDVSRSPRSCSAAASSGRFRSVPDAFLRFILIGLAHTLYRVRIVGRSNVPAVKGCAPGAQPRVVRRRPVRHRQHRPAGAVRGLRRLLPQAVHRLGSAVDEGDPDLPQRRPEDDPASVSRGWPCPRPTESSSACFPEGQLTRTGVMAPFQRGLRADRQGAHHADHPGPSRPPERQHLQPGELAGGCPSGFRYPVTVSIRQAAARRTPPCTRFARRFASSTRRRGPTARTIAGRCTTGSFARRGGTRSGWPLPTFERRKVSYFKALAGSMAIARALRTRWEGQANVGILLPASVGGALVNLAATLAGKAVVNLNFTTGRRRHGVGGRAGRAPDRRHQPGLSGEGEARAADGHRRLIFLEDVMAGITPQGPLVRSRSGIPRTGSRCWNGSPGPSRKPTVDDTATIIFSSGSTGDPKGVVLSHFNIDSNVEAIGQVYRVLQQRSADRNPAALSLVRLHDVLVRGQFGDGDGLPSQPARRRPDRRRWSSGIG